jgi:thiol-disulfide isomerase/thioredoxin
MTQVTRRSAILGAVGICLSAGRVSLAGGPANKAIAWQSSLQDAHKIALQQNKPMMLVFGAEWCGYCKKLEKTTLSNPQLSKYINSTFVSVHVDVDEEEKVAKILEVKSLPCTIILSPNADLLGSEADFCQEVAFGNAAADRWYCPVAKAPENGFRESDTTPVSRLIASALPVAGRVSTLQYGIATATPQPIAPDRPRSNPSRPHRSSGIRER